MAEIEAGLPQVPRVHLNGTSRGELVAQQRAVYEAAEALLDALRQATPNGRDYYPLGDEAFRRAREEHRGRMCQADAIKEVAGEIAQAILGAE